MGPANLDQHMDFKNIRVMVRGDIAERSAPLINAPRRELVHA